MGITLASAQTKTPVDSNLIVGAVRMEPDLRPVARAVIRVESPATQNFRVTFTDSLGRYRLLLPGEGPYVISAGLPGTYRVRREQSVWLPHFCQPGTCSTIDTLNFFLRKHVLPLR